MRLAAIADIHGNSAALEAVLEDIGRQGVDGVVNLGDCLAGPLDPAGTAARLMALRLPTVQGNHDRWMGQGEEVTDWERQALPATSPQVRRWLSDLPPTRVWNGVFLCHATPGDDLSYWLHEPGGDGRMRPAAQGDVDIRAEGIAERLLLCGHTHLAAAVRLSDGRLVVNPGSVGCPAFRDDDPRPHRVEARNPAAHYAVLSDGPLGWDVSFRMVAYDTAPMVALARAAGAEDWARALATGFATA